MHHTGPALPTPRAPPGSSAKLARLLRLADDHFSHDPDAVHWGHVGDLGRAEQALDDLLAIFDGQPG